MLRARVQVDLATSLPSSTHPNQTLAERRAAFLALPEPIGQPAYEMQADGSIFERGTGLALLVDPERQTVHVYTPDDPLVPRALGRDDRLDLGDLLPDPPTVAELFAALTPEP